MPLPLQVNIGIRVLTRPTPAKLPEIYRTLGTDYGERVLPSIIQVQAQKQQTRWLLAVGAALDARHSMCSMLCTFTEGDLASPGVALPVTLLST